MYFETGVKNTKLQYEEPILFLLRLSVKEDAYSYTNLTLVTEDTSLALHEGTNRQITNKTAWGVSFMLRTQIAG